MNFGKTNIHTIASSIMCVGKKDLTQTLEGLTTAKTDLLSKKELCHQPVFRLELQLFPESPACWPTLQTLGLSGFHNCVNWFFTINFSLLSLYICVYMYTHTHIYTHKHTHIVLQFCLCGECWLVQMAKFIEHLLCDKFFQLLYKYWLLYLILTTNRWLVK